MTHPQNSVPGLTARIDTEEINVFWSGHGNQQHLQATWKGMMQSAQVDSGNTPTTTLRGGQVVALEEGSTQDLYVYDQDAVDGTQGAVGYLDFAQNMLVDGTAADRWLQYTRQGRYRVAELKASSQTLGLQVHSQLMQRGNVPDDMRNRYQGANSLIHPLLIDRKGAAYTVTADDNGKQILVTAAATITLPAITAALVGLTVDILNIADNTVTVTGGANSIIYGDAGGAYSTNLAWSTSNKKMGGHIIVQAVRVDSSGTMKWAVYDLGTTITSS